MMRGGKGMDRKELTTLTELDESYINQMEAWLREQEAREKQILNTIETSSEIVKQNKIQLEWHRKSYNSALKEYEEWKESKEIK